MKRVTIIGEALARAPLQRLIAESGAHGHTLFPVEGQGSQGRRTGDIQEFANIQVEVIAPPDVAARLLERLDREFFPRFAMVAYESDIRVVRSGKF